MNTLTLPEGYQEIWCVNLQKDRKAALLVNLFSLAIMLLLLWLGRSIITMQEYITSVVPLLMQANIPIGWIIVLLVVAAIAAIAIYMVLHELIHGIFMKRYSGVKPRYGFTGMYAYAGSDAYFDRKSYIIIALAPVVIWGVVLALLLVLLPREWFWLLYLIQIINLSGAAGDIYITYKMLRMPKDILVCDAGVSMRVYGTKTVHD